jgi:hypothetical protein
VQIAGTTIATAMATATDLETAEDRAKSRALEAIGIAGFGSDQAIHSPKSLFLPTPVPENRGTENSQASLSQSKFAQPTLEQVSASVDPNPPGATFSKKLELVQPAPELPESSYPTSLTASSAHLSALNEPAIRAEPSTLNQAKVATFAVPQPAASDLPIEDKPSARAKSETKSEKASKSKSEPASAHDPADRSEEIMKIGIEMKRLGWSTEQGREYLKRTYGKRSRQELDDAELLDFLHHLETQPSPLQTPF